MTESIEFPMTGETRNFRFFVQNTVGAAGVAVTDLLQQNCEVDLNKLIGIFNKGLPPELPFKIVIDESDDGASHSGCSETEIHIGFNKTLRSKFSPGKMASIYRLLLVAEVVEVFEAMMREWNCGFAPGEGLSRVLALYVVPAGEFNSTSADWLATKPLQNWVAQIDPSDQNPVSIGCAVLFLNWLHYVKGFSWVDIVAADSGKLSGVYKALTKSDNGWAVFSADIEARRKAGQLTDVVTDQPFPVE